MDQTHTDLDFASCLHWFLNHRHLRGSRGNYEQYLTPEKISTDK